MDFQVTISNVSNVLWLRWTDSFAVVVFLAVMALEISTEFDLQLMIESGISSEESFFLFLLRPLEFLLSMTLSSSRLVNSSLIAPPKQRRPRSFCQLDDLSMLINNLSLKSPLAILAGWLPVALSLSISTLPILSCQSSSKRARTKS